MPDSIEEEAIAAYSRFVATRDEIDQGRKQSPVLADSFTEDGAYIVPASIESTTTATATATD